MKQNVEVIVAHSDMKLVKVSNRSGTEYLIEDRYMLTAAGQPIVVSRFTDAYEAVKAFTHLASLFE